MKTILFDLDGTLTDPMVGITTCVQYALTQMGIAPPPNDELTYFIGPPLTDTFMERWGFTKEQALFALEKYRERFSVTGIFENELYPGIDALLRELSEKARLCVATSKPEIFTARILEHFGIDGYFACVSGSELDGRRVEKSDVIAEGLSRLSVSDLSSAVMVGDRRFDVEGARENGIKSIAVAYGYAEPGELAAAKPDQTANTVAELRALLEAFVQED